MHGPLSSMAKADADLIGKRVQFDHETWQAVDLLSRDSMRDFQELADEAFRDLLKKHGRPIGFKAALKESARKERPPRKAAGQRTRRHGRRQREARA